MPETPVAGETPVSPLIGGASLLPTSSVPPVSPAEVPLDMSRPVLEFVHRLVLLPVAEQADLAGLLAELTASFGASGAGLASFPEGVAVSMYPAPPGNSLAEIPLSWYEQAGLHERWHNMHGALRVPHSGVSRLVTVLGTAERGGWLLWLEESNGRTWSDRDASLLVLVGHALTHRLACDETLLSWAAQLDHAFRQHRLDASACVVRRLAHDFGNILTGILGFSELILSQQSSSHSTLHAYVTEIHRGAQNGAQYTSQLGQFARRHTANNRSCNLAAILTEEERRLSSLLNANVRFRLDLPADLPLAAVETESMRQALGLVLDNAREAIGDAGTIEVAVRSVQLNARQAGEVFGHVRPGSHLEIRVADNGSGLSVEAQRQLFAEPFFSTRPRKRGFGLAMTYGILAAHRGGLALLSRSEGGTIARLIVPVAANPSAVPTGGTTSASPRKERVLVVDDDPMILQLVATTLERAGYRVQTVGNAEEALKIYRGAAGDPFRLVLSDVLMPNVNGIDLARRLLAQDANVSLLFMSGQVPIEIMQQTFGAGRFELLSKPFRPEGLVRAVRAAIDRSACRTETGLPKTR